MQGFAWPDAVGTALGAVLAFLWVWRYGLAGGELQRIGRILHGVLAGAVLGAMILGLALRVMAFGLESLPYAPNPLFVLHDHQWIVVAPCATLCE